jgi:hypothetical protein
MSLPRRLSLVTLGARDVPALRAFYERLGWQVAVADGDEFASFHLGGAVLALYSRPLLHEEAAPGEPDGEGFGGVTLACNVDERDEVDAAYGHALAAGATPVHPPVDRSWGGRSAYFADPEGNRWEVAWAPGVRFDERGAVTAFGPQ